MSDENLNAGNYSGIPDSNAHAWTEVYYPIIGWQVVDCTPYYSEKQLPEENKINNDRDSDSATETDTESESDTETDIQTDTENDTDTSTEESISTDSDFSPSDDSDSIKEKAASQKEDSKFNNFLRVTINILFVILRIVIILALIVAIWFLIRFIVLKIRFAKFNSSDTRKGAKSMYLHSLFLLKIMGVTPKNSEGDREFAKRAVLNLEDIRTAEYENFTDIALNARFGKDSPSKDDISRMNDFIDELSKSVYNSSKLWKKLLIKYILFLK